MVLGAAVAAASMGSGGPELTSGTPGQSAGLPGSLSFPEQISLHQMVVAGRLIGYPARWALASVNLPAHPSREPRGNPVVG